MSIKCALTSEVCLSNVHLLLNYFCSLHTYFQSMSVECTPTCKVCLILECTPTSKVCLILECSPTSNVCLILKCTPTSKVCSLSPKS